MKRTIEKHSVALLALLLLCASFASAGVTEIVASFPNQTAIMPPTAIGSPMTGNYWIAATMTSASYPWIIMRLRWTDPFGQPQLMVSNGTSSAEACWPDSTGDYEALCAFVSVQAGSVVTIETDGPSYTGQPYEVDVAGFGLSGGVQAQGGIKEPISTTNLNLTGIYTRVLLTPSVDGYYLIFMRTVQTGNGRISRTCSSVSLALLFLLPTSRSRFLASMSRMLSVSVPSKRCS